MKAQVFTIMLTTKGAVGWGEAMDLLDADREWLYERCSRHNEDLEREMDKARRGARGRT